MWNYLKKIGKFIMNLFKVNGELSIDTSNIWINGERSDLSICKMSESEYTELVKSDSCISNMLYVVESDFINANGQQLKNLADPTDQQDAVTKKYFEENMPKDLDFDESKYVLKSDLKDNVKNIMLDLLKN